ncbi:MAG: hypothetical protein QM778_38070 [Myxococcales bacterium]
MRSPLLLLAVCAFGAACSGSNDDEFYEIDGGPERDASLDDGDEEVRMDAGDAPDPMDAGLDADVGATDASLDGGTDASGNDAQTNDAGDAAAEQVAVLSLDFEGNTLPSELDPGDGLLTPTQLYASVGHPGNTFGAQFLRSATGNVVTLTLTNLPPHTSLSIYFLFAAIDSLDGIGSPPSDDYFRVTLDGANVFREFFANALESQVQSYDTPPPPDGVVLVRRMDLGFSGPGSYYTDSAYDFSLEPRFQDWPHTASSAVITFTLEGTGNQALDDESWAIDNLRVTVGDTPRQRSDAGTN